MTQSYIYRTTERLWLIDIITSDQTSTRMIVLPFVVIYPWQHCQWELVKCVIHVERIMCNKEFSQRGRQPRHTSDFPNGRGAVKVSEWKPNKDNNNCASPIFSAWIPFLSLLIYMLRPWYNNAEFRQHAISSMASGVFKTIHIFTEIYQRDMDNSTHICGHQRWYWCHKHG
jgi:hypothetical protein